MMPYSFPVVTESGHVYYAHYATYKEAYRRSKLNGDAPIYFTGPDGVKQPVGHLAGQEAYA